MQNASKYILGVRVDFGLSMGDVLDRVEKFINGSKCHIISTTNPEFIITAQTDPLFKEIINKSDFSLPDGVGLLYAKQYLEVISKFHRDAFYGLKCLFYGLWLGVFGVMCNLGERISGVDFVYELCKLSDARGYNVFLLGGWEKNFWGKPLSTCGDISQRAAKELKRLYPNLKVIGTTSKFSHRVEDDAATLDFIKNCMRCHDVSHIDILLVAYNHSGQEKWIARNIKHIPAKVAMGVGGTFDYIAGTKRRAPPFIFSRNLEWLFRLVTQPWRLRRIFTAFPTFPVKVFLHSIKNP
jgi:N-acetylglucosaminyldiphosphoundecaprenol N-acetyl-beta-D-mannosaminyltransferase